jgi:hypothetical protein
MSNCQIKVRNGAGNNKDHLVTLLQFLTDSDSQRYEVFRFEDDIEIMVRDKVETNKTLRLTDVRK